jgi:hypothetical protein
VEDWRSSKRLSTDFGCLLAGVSFNNTSFAGGWERNQTKKTERKTICERRRWRVIEIYKKEMKERKGRNVPF